MDNSNSVIIQEVELLVGGIKKKIPLHFVEVGFELGKDISKYYVIDAFGRRVYVKTNNRLLAQEVVDEWFGANKYTVRCSGIEKISGEVTVRASEFRKNQNQQRQKAKILYG